MSTRQEIENQMKELLGEGYCNSCKKLNFLKCYLCKVNYCSVACMILDDHEHAPGACIWDAVGKFDAGNKSTVPHKTNKQKKIEETLTFKVMKDKLPEHVKQGVHISVQGRLKKALENMAVSDDKTDNAKGLAGEFKNNSKEKDSDHTVSDRKDKAVKEFVRNVNIDLKSRNDLYGNKQADIKSNLDFKGDLTTKINAQSDEERRKIWKSFVEAREKELALLDNQLSALKLQN